MALRPVARGLITAAVYLLALAVIAVAVFFAVMVFAGPHSGLLPDGLGAAVLILGWLIVLVLPVWIAVMCWRRLG